MKRQNVNTENAPVKTAADGITFKGEIANNAGEDVRNVTAANLARTTVVRFKLVHLMESDPAKMLEDRELTVKYCNSVSTAEKAVAEVLRAQGVDMRTNRVMVYDYQNERAERRVYNATDILRYADAVYTDEESARQYAQTLEDVNWSIRKVDSYAYGALAWTREDVTETDVVESFVWDDTERYTGLRSYTSVINAILKARYQSVAKDNADAHQKRVVYVDPESRVRIERPKYAVITAGKLAQCGYKVVGDKDAADESNAEVETNEE